MRRTFGRSPVPGNATVNSGKVDADVQASKAVKLGVGVLRRVLRTAYETATGRGPSRNTRSKVPASSNTTTRS